MTFELPKLPYDTNELIPHISAETLEYHYGKHHQTYVTKLNGLLEANSQHSGKSLEEIIKSSDGGIFNNAAQVWNHTFYWNCLSSNGGGVPKGKIHDAITEAFGSFNAFKEKFTTTAVANFGSGWTWLVKNKSGKLEIVNTSNAGLPYNNGFKTDINL